MSNTKKTGILSFDFDGTLYSSFSTESVSLECRKLIQTLSDDGNYWGINTGRSFSHLMEGIEEAAFLSKPDFIVARERDIYFFSHETGDYIQDVWWRKQRDNFHDVLFSACGDLLDEIKNYVEKETRAQWVSEPGDEAGLIATSLEEMEMILEFVDSHVTQIEDLDYLRSTIYLRFTHKDFHKGSSLDRVRRQLDVPIERVFTMGDGENDLGMLHPQYAGMICCPANAVAAVKQRVRKHKGYVATEDVSLGVIESLKKCYESVKS